MMMRTLMRTKVYPLIAPVIIVGAIFIYGAVAVRAAADDSVIEIEDWVAEYGENQTITPALTVDEVFLIGDELFIAVTDKDGGDKQVFVLALSDYALPSDEFVTIQAIDGKGRASDVICFANPYYAPPPELPDDDTVSAIPDTTRPLTPDGAGSVVDNVTNEDAKEFFTVETPDGNMFYLIVDRQRNAENVYLLNAVTENDLFSLAQPGSGGVSAIQTPEPPVVAEPPSEPVKEPEHEPVPENKNDNTGNLIFLGLALIIGGGAGYYFKILKPKQDGAGGYDDDSESYDNEDYDETKETIIPDDEEEEYLQ